MTTDDLLKQGIAALNEGWKTEARNLLMQVVEQDERNEMAWLWLSGAVDTEVERRICLENVLVINPNNGVAKRGLASLITRESLRPSIALPSPTPRAEPAATSHEQPAQPPADVSAADVPRRKKRKNIPQLWEEIRQRTTLMIGLRTGVLVFAFGALATLWWAVYSGLPLLGSAAPVAADATQTASARDLTPTPTPSPTYVPTWTPTPGPTNTSILTQTPWSTDTSGPTAAPILTPTAAVQMLGPIWDPLRDESYTAQISLAGVRFHSGDDFSKPKPGHVYVIVDVTIKNLGPSSMRSVGRDDFQVRDANDVLRDSVGVPDTDDCELDLVDLTPNGSVSGCIGFEVPVDGTLELIYAPHEYEGLEPGRYLDFTIRQ